MELVIRRFCWNGMEEETELGIWNPHDDTLLCLHRSLDIPPLSIGNTTFLQNLWCFMIHVFFDLRVSSDQIWFFVAFCLSHLGVSKNSGTTQIIHFNRVFHYTPSILVYPYLRKPPFAPLRSCYQVRWKMFTWKTWGRRLASRCFRWCWKN